MRLFCWSDDRRALWDKAQPFLRNPVVRRYRFGERLELKNAKLGGVSALSHYSMLTDDLCTVNAVSREAEKVLMLDKIPQIPDEETAATIVHILRYDFEYGDGIAIDPLTAILSLTEDEKTDPRVGSAIETILEECLHD